MGRAKLPSIAPPINTRRIASPIVSVMLIPSPSTVHSYRDPRSVPVLQPHFVALLFLLFLVAGSRSQSVFSVSHKLFQKRYTIASSGLKDPSVITSHILTIWRIGKTERLCENPRKAGREYAKSG